MMNISRKKLLSIRFLLLNPISLKTQNPNPQFSSNFQSLYHTFKTPFYIHRYFSISSNNSRNPEIIRPKSPPLVSHSLVSKLVDVVKSTNGNDDCRPKLDLIETKLSKKSVCEIFSVLSVEKIPAFRFFEWVRDNNMDLYRNVDVCSLMVDNCGWVGDYDMMRAVLERFREEGVCVNDKAFGFLPVLDSRKADVMEKVELVVRILGDVGGSVGNSGVYELIRMLCGVDCFDLAKFVMEIAGKKLGYYAILVREKCRRGCLDEAYGLIGEMREAGFEPDCKIYNYILGSLCKHDKLSEALSLFKEMKENGVDPNAITFEVFIANSCRLGRLEFASESLKRLMHTGLPSRVSTHVAIVKGYCNAGRYDEAYEYVRDMEVKKVPTTNKMYTVLARMHQRKGNVDAARKILDEMMERGLKPDFASYSKTVNVLKHTGSRDLAQGLQKQFSKFRIE